MSMGRKRPSEPEGEDQVYRSIFEAAGDGLIIHDAATSRVVEANPAAAAMHGYEREQFIGLHLKDYIHPDSQRLFSEALRAMQSGGVFESPAVHLRHDGSPFYVEARRTAVTYRSRLCLLSVVRDISERVHAEKLLHRQMEVRESEQSTLLDVSHTLASTLELKPDLILNHLRMVVEYSHAALFVLEDAALEDAALVAVALHGVQPPKGAVPFHIRIESPDVLAQLFNEHRPIRVADVTGTDQQAKFLHSLLDNGSARLLDGVRAWMWIPLAVKGRIIGGLGMGHPVRDYFTSHHADLALIVANQAAITMINSELYKNAQTLAVLQERQRLAQNLHDAVNQSLFSAGLIAEVLPRLWDRDQVLARESLEDLRNLTRGAMAEMRALLAELRPATLTDAELGDLVRLLGNGFTGRTNIPVRLTVVGQDILPPDVQVAIYRICQEALQNIAKHAGASKVEISLNHEAVGIELSIRDNGRGFDPKQTSSGHYGLSMMRERAETAGVLFSVTSRPGRGTELSIRWKKTAPADKQRAFVKIKTAAQETPTEPKKTSRRNNAVERADDLI